MLGVSDVLHEASCVRRCRRSVIAAAVIQLSFCEIFRLSAAAIWPKASGWSPSGSTGSGANCSRANRSVARRLARVASSAAWATPRSSSPMVAAWTRLAAIGQEDVIAGLDGGEDFGGVVAKVAYSILLGRDDINVARRRRDVRRSAHGRVLAWAQRPRHRWSCTTDECRSWSGARPTNCTWS